MSGILAICGDIVCSAGPWITGMVSGYFTRNEKVVSAWAERGFDATQAAIRKGLLAALIFPLSMFIGLILTGKKREQEA